VRITVYPVMTPFWSRRSGGCHCISAEVEERTRIWIALGAADGSGGWKFNNIAIYISIHIAMPP